MEMPTHRTWMYNRLLPGRKDYTTEYLKGVEEFIDFACRQPKYLSEGVIRCPCKHCKNEKHLTPDEVNVHILKNGFTPRYWYWTSHGEKVPHINDDVEVHPVSQGCKNTSELSAAVIMLSLKSKQNMSQAYFNDWPQLTQCQPQHTQPPPPPPLPPQSHTTKSQPIPTQVRRMKLMEEYPMVNESPTSSSSDVRGGNNENKIMILPERDGFDQHKLVVETIASIIRTNLKEAKPSWKQLSIGQRNSWFNIFKSKFTWQPQYKDLVRRNFEERGSAKMFQLMQEVKKNLDQKPTWMEDGVWAQLKAHWESSSFEKKSKMNKRNRDSMDGVSFHTNGSIPHRLHWKRMEAKGTDPSLAEFYFRTQRKQDQSWMGPRAESTYDKFEQRKFELSSQSSTFTLGEDGTDSHSSIDHMPSDLDIWVNSLGKKKRRIFGLGSIGKTLCTSSSQPSKLSANSEEVVVLRNQIKALNESLQRQEQEKQEMRHELTQIKNQGSIGKILFTCPSQSTKLFSHSEEVDVLRNQINALNESLHRQEQEKLEMRQELTQTKKQVAALMQHLGFVDSSSFPSSSPKCSSVNDDGDSDTISDSDTIDNNDLISDSDTISDHIE